MITHTLLMDGPDDKGLIYRVTSVLYKNECNILRQDEYVSPQGRFFMRTSFACSIELEPEKVLSDLRELIPDEQIRFRINPYVKKKIVLLCTKEHHCVSELIIRYLFHEINAEIVAVISNYDSLEHFVTKFNIPFHFVSHESKTRTEHEQQMLQLLASYQPEYIVLAKYMRVLSPDFVQAYPNRIINIHHSFLPAFIGANPYRQAYDRGVKIIGATAHFVNNDLDEGPIIAQDVIEVDHRYTAKDMAKEGKDVEKMVLTKALRLVLDDRVFVYNNRTIIL